MATKRTRKPAAIASPVAGPVALAGSHDAAGTGRRMRGWMPSSSGPNREIGRAHV